MNPLTADSYAKDVAAFHFCDHNQQPIKCRLLVHPSQGWAVATELPDTKGLVQAAPALAAKICQQYTIDPSFLTLLTRHINGNYYEAYYAVHFGHSERGLQNSFCFQNATRQLLGPEEIALLLQRLQAGVAPDPALRALKSPYRTPT
jgi:hypothetical protein